MINVQSLIQKYDLEGFYDVFVKHDLLDEKKITLKNQDEIEEILGINRLADRKKLFMFLEDLRNRDSVKGLDEIPFSLDGSNRVPNQRKLKRNKEQFGKMYTKLRDQKKKRNILIKKPIPFLNLPSSSQSTQSKTRRSNPSTKILRKFLCSHESCIYETSSSNELKKHMKGCNLKPNVPRVSEKNRNNMIDKLKKQVKSVKIVKDRAEQIHKQEILVVKTKNRKQKVEVNKLRSDVTELMNMIVQKDKRIKDQQLTISRLSELVKKLTRGREVNNEFEHDHSKMSPKLQVSKSSSPIPKHINKMKKKKKRSKKVKKKIEPHVSPIKLRSERKKREGTIHEDTPSKSDLVMKVVEEEEDYKEEEEEVNDNTNSNNDDEFTVHTVHTVSSVLPDAFKHSPSIPNGNKREEKEISSSSSSAIRNQSKKGEVDNIEFEISREITPFVDSDDDDDDDEDSSDDGMMRFGEDPRFAKEEQEELKKLRRGLVGKRRKSLPPSPKQYEKFRKYYNNIYEDDVEDLEKKNKKKNNNSNSRRGEESPKSQNHDVEEEERKILRRLIMEEEQMRKNQSFSRNDSHFQSGINRNSFGVLGTPTDYLSPDFVFPNSSGNAGRGGGGGGKDNTIGGPGPDSGFRPSQLFHHPSVERESEMERNSQLEHRPPTRPGVPQSHRRYNIQQKKWTFVPVKDSDRQFHTSSSKLHTAKITVYRGNTEWKGGQHEYVVKIDRISGVGFGLKIGLEDGKGQRWFLCANGRIVGPGGKESAYTRRYFRKGDHVGVHFDLERGNLWFSINGKQLGHAFYCVEGCVRPVCVLMCSGNIVTLKNSN